MKPLWRVDTISVKLRVETDKLIIWFYLLLYIYIHLHTHEYMYTYKYIRIKTNGKIFISNTFRPLMYFIKINDILLKFIRRRNVGKKSFYLWSFWYCHLYLKFYAHTQFLSPIFYRLRNLLMYTIAFVAYNKKLSELVSELKMSYQTSGRF